jgi:tetratricopeptide (TPR) repeat protein
LDKAIATLASVGSDASQDVLTKALLLDNHSRRARAHAQLKNYADAVKDLDRAIEVSSPAQQANNRAGRAMYRAKAGMVAEAVAEAAELTKSTNWKANQWYDFACIYGVASGKIAEKKVEYADRAMDLLAQAVTAGYKDAAHMKTDTDLDPLRDREDFKKLVVDLEAKFPPKKETLPPPRADK